ncbi:hypothetical protein C900_01147 [Fulvivirga imtechensis AK7]|uniref:Uncharacterized protein n=1 Tax=Fulvivirga imtechensis AK7 TaxID=1237149 RepID=L8JX69_9BACT|nr:hypothetical protein C900_01147 [Fulvivirga imtechensis AK7]
MEYDPRSLVHENQNAPSVKKAGSVWLAIVILLMKLNQERRLSHFFTNERFL